MSATYLEQSCESSEEAGFSSQEVCATKPVSACPGAVKSSKSTYKPCDVVRLYVRSVSGTGDDSFEQLVVCDGPSEKDTSLTKAQRALLGADDALLQTVADYHRDGTYDPKKMLKVTVVPSAKIAPICALHEETGLIWKGHDGKSEQLALNQSTPIELLAESTRAFSGTGGFLKPFWSFSESRKIVEYAIADSCGVRAGGIPNGSLRTRVEVWPNDIFELTFKIPPLFSHKKMKETFINLRNLTHSTESSAETKDRVSGVNTSSKEVKNAAKGDDYSTQSRSATDSSGIVHSRETTRGLKGTDDTKPTEEVKKTEFTQSSPVTAGLFIRKKTTTVDLTGKASDESKEVIAVSQQVSLKRNGIELDISKTINSVIKATRDFQSIVTELQEVVPKVGWYSETSITVLEGSITGTWGTAPELNSEHSRIWRVIPYYSVAFNVNLFSAYYKIGFGLKIEVSNWFASDPLLKVDLSAELLLSLYVPINLTFSSNDRANYVRTVTETAKYSLKGTATAMALGYGIESSVDLSGNLEISGKLSASLAKAPVYEGKAVLTPLVITVTVSRSDSKPWVEEVFKWPEQPWTIWSGSLPSSEKA
jgi:hypothetical protein